MTRNVPPFEMLRQPAADARHIAILTSGVGAGGAERVIALLSRHWILRGMRVTIMTFDPADAPVYHHFDRGVRFVTLVDEGAGWRRTMHRIGTVRRALRHERPDLLISFLTKMNLLALIAGVGTGVPVIAAERNNPKRQQASGAWNLGLALFYRRAAAIVCQTQASVACLPRGVRGRTRVIPNPVVPLGMAGEEGAVKHLVAVGRLTHQKGFDLLIDAFARVAPLHPDWQLHIWGEGPDRTALTAQIARLNMDDRIALRGLSERPGGWIADADAFALPSRYEGFPNALGEAMAAGLPVVAARCDFGPAELVRDGENGLLVVPDDAGALAAGIDRLLGDAPLRERLRRAAPAIIDRFSMESIVAMWDEMLSENEMKMT